MLVLINVAALRWAWLVLGWVTHLWVTKPPWYATNYPGQLSLAILLSA